MSLVISRNQRRKRTRFSSSINSLLSRVESRVVDTRCSSDTRSVEKEGQRRAVRKNERLGTNRMSTSPGTATFAPYAVTASSSGLSRDQRSVLSGRFKQSERIGSSQLGNISEENRRTEVPFDVSLFEGFDLCRKDMLHLSLDPSLSFELTEHES